MRTLNPSDYKDVLEKIEMSYDRIIDSIRQQRLTFINIKNDIVEWNLKLPVFVRPFYAYVYRKNKIPTQEEFFNYYILCNSDYFQSNSFSPDILEGIKARAYRAMPSIVRDFCFNKFVFHNIQGCNVMYSIDLDVEEGIDLLLYNENNMYGVCLYTDTKRSYDGRKAKEHRHVQFDNVTYIEFPVTFSSCERVGDYFLYGKEEYNKLINKLQLCENY
jgi:hypothetical protein